MAVPMIKTRQRARWPDAIDVHVGSRIRMQRCFRGLTQSMLGQSVGVTFQQVQKYEKGTNRVGSSRLQAIADALGVSVSFFFEGASGASGELEEAAGQESEELRAFLGSSEGLAFNRAFLKIRDGKVRRKFLGLVKALAATGSVP